ncbi:hypothetical protein PhCBS80983_g03403 [Powellomyces hirtus]|uniref:ORMDL family protein n=1 Tax=Powellomyces hirtus TaxID=109895 RepID=A0A507E1Y3_9FUNG|nr:hypothetical protein PhCBS80983_g03403 [Powellomyces hirtus]
MENCISQTNPNSTWVNLRGSWLTNLLVMVLIRLGAAIVPGISTEASWTLTNLAYNLSTFIMFHWVTGIPFDLNQNEYEGLTLWEQIDNGEQFTPTKKYFTALPIALFLLSTHYTHYDVTTFMINLASLLVVLIAKLPAMHKHSEGGRFSSTPKFPLRNTGKNSSPTHLKVIIDLKATGSEGRHQIHIPSHSRSPSPRHLNRHLTIDRVKLAGVAVEYGADDADAEGLVLHVGRGGAPVGCEQRGEEAPAAAGRDDDVACRENVLNARADIAVMTGGEGELWNVEIV